MSHPYLWIVVAGGIASFLMGGGMGANDLANAFGTTYGAKVLTLVQIVAVAAVCEFAGAVSLGAQVTTTLASGIARPELFQDEPYVLMFGMLCAILAAVSWLFAATAMTLPVSSTHSIAGAIMGFALVRGGRDGVIWVGAMDAFPYVHGVAPIVASWVISPVLTGLVCALLFTLIRAAILRSSNSATRATYALPCIVMLIVFFEVFFILDRGAASHVGWDTWTCLGVACGAGVGGGALSTAAIPPLLRVVGRHHAPRDSSSLSDPILPDPAAYGSSDVEPAVGTPTHQSARQLQAPAWIPAPPATDHGGDGALPDVEAFDPRAEYVFRYVQVLTAICMSFAHGASDVSNSIAPFAAMYEVYTTGEVPKRVVVEVWILCLGGAGIVVGLATCGVRLMRLFGESITRITPSRGFTAELSTALVVSLASASGIPISSTHSITGAIFAIRIVDAGIHQLNWSLALKMYAGWVFTMVITAAVSAVLFAFGVQSPTVR